MNLNSQIVVFFAGLLGLWLVFKLLNVVVSLSWIFVLGFIILFIFNPRFRNLVKNFFNSIFNR